MKAGHRPAKNGGLFGKSESCRASEWQSLGTRQPICPFVPPKKRAAIKAARRRDFDCCSLIILWNDLNHAYPLTGRLDDRCFGGPQIFRRQQQAKIVKSDFGLNLGFVAALDVDDLSKLGELTGG